jgi:hypothetical protein
MTERRRGHEQSPVVEPTRAWRRLDCRSGLERGSKNLPDLALVAPAIGCPDEPLKVVRVISCDLGDRPPNVSAEVDDRADVLGGRGGCLRTVAFAILAQATIVIICRSFDRVGEDRPGGVQGCHVRLESADVGMMPGGEGSVRRPNYRELGDRVDLKDPIVVSRLAVDRHFDFSVLSFCGHHSATFNLV